MRSFPLYLLSSPFTIPSTKAESLLYSPPQKPQCGTYVLGTLCFKGGESGAE
jgi:hypothetical protein